MISRAIDTWSNWTTWAKWAPGIAAIVLIEATSTASRQRNFISDFVEHAAAPVLRYGLMALMIGGGSGSALRSPSAQNRFIREPTHLKRD